MLYTINKPGLGWVLPFDSFRSDKYYRMFLLWRLLETSRRVPECPLWWTLGSHLRGRCEVSDKDACLAREQSNYSVSAAHIFIFLSMFKPPEVHAFKEKKINFFQSWICFLQDVQYFQPSNTSRPYPITCRFLFGFHTRRHIIFHFNGMISHRRLSAAHNMISPSPVSPLASADDNGAPLAKVLAQEKSLQLHRTGGNVWLMELFSSDHVTPWCDGFKWFYKDFRGKLNDHPLIHPSISNPPMYFLTTV